MTMGQFDPSREPDSLMADINITPFVDVMLVLWVILIVTVPLLSHSVRLNLPQTKAAAPAELIPQHSITVSLNADGHIFWDDVRVVDEQALFKLMLEAAQRQPQTEVRLRADGKVRYQAVAALLAQLQEAGIQKIGFVMLPPNPHRDE